MMPPWKSDRTENSELHIQTSELSVFGDWGGKVARLAE
jgi:hypothetical protein